MTKNKIFFIIIGILVFIGLIYFAIQLGNSGTQKTGTKASPGDFQVWILEDDIAGLKEFTDGFKESYPAYASQNIVVESFSDTQAYYNSLSSAFMQGIGPDVFVLPNSESSIFENQISVIDPNTISPNDFRLDFKPIFGNDLIVSDSEDSTIEYVKGIPLGYEALGLFYNRKYFLRPSDLTTWEDILVEINTIKERYSDIVPIALGNGFGVTRAASIISAFLVLEGTESLVKTNTTQSRQALSIYTAFGQKDGDNRYNIISAPFLNNTDIEFFTQGDVASMVGYPRDLLKIDDIGYQSTLLYATPFPSYSGKDNISSIKYNYFVINKDSVKQSMASELLSYMATAEGQNAFQEIYPYYLPTSVAGESEILERKILPEYNIIYKNFIDQTATQVSFDVGDVNIYNNRLREILDQQSGYETLFDSMKAYVVCTATKQTTLLNLSSPCK
ncbi:carbohydrate ABC transporter substrate-binding protein [Candidatus Gracilibacteria bacterium]|nr:carbohydrate ABC transporter substrate-binding protein [Candidatus Gracilibacteria bacterium]